jgi:RNA polymerase sigma factor (TIGR02999 family)
MSDVTRILNAIQAGEPKAASELLPLVYDELRRLAASKLDQEKPGQTLDATGLVHEAYLRLVGPGNESKWDHRGHFFVAAAEAMRRILIENARRKQTQKRGGGLERQDFDESLLAAPEVPDDLLALDAALTRLAEIDRTAADVVQLRFFAGLALPQVAKLLDISPRTADRRWAYARAWLFHEISGAP